MFMYKFYLKETLKSFSKAKLSSFFSFITTSVAIILTLTSLALVLFSDALQRDIIDRVSINLFLEEDLSENKLNEIVRELRELDFLKKVNYISKSDAEKEFILQTGEDFRRILEYNPLPASIEVNIKPNYFSNINGIKDQLSRIDGVEEVYSQTDFIQSILNVLSKIKYYLVVAAIILILISFYLVYSTNRIILQTKIKQIETMKLVGARLSTIKIPIILNGLIIGILSSALVVFLITYLLYMVKNYYTINLISFVDNGLLLFLFVLFCGVIIGTLGSYLAVKKVSLRVNKIAF